MVGKRAAQAGLQPEAEEGHPVRDVPEVLEAADDVPGAGFPCHAWPKKTECIADALKKYKQSDDIGLLLCSMVRISAVELLLSSGTSFTQGYFEGDDDFLEYDLFSRRLKSGERHIFGDFGLVDSLFLLSQAPQNC